MCHLIVGLFIQVMLNFVGSQEEAMPFFHIMSHDTQIIQSGTKRKCLFDFGINDACTLNVNWDGTEPVSILTFH